MKQTHRPPRSIYPAQNRHMRRRTRVLAGLVDKPVIALPTSVGYGANFHGLSALLTMLNSCAEGIAVVNIDNGFGAGYLAAQINRLVCKNND